MRATETPLDAMMVKAGHDGDGASPGLYDTGYPAMMATVTPLGAMKVSAGHDGNGDPQALRGIAMRRKGNSAMMATVSAQTRS